MDGDHARSSAAVEAALAEAERKGFRLAVLGWTAAVLANALFYLPIIPGPSSVVVAGVAIVLSGIGLAPLALVRRRGERAGRYAFFAIGVLTVSAMLAVVPISSSGDIPQNFVFFSSRHHYYYVLIAVSVLTLAPALVLWTGLCAVLGLAVATGLIAAGMERVVSYADLPPAPSREAYLAVVHDPGFLNISARVNEALALALTTAVAALAVQRARSVVRAHAAVEQKRGFVQQLLGRYVPAQVADELVDEGRLAPQLRDATILFADIEGFTRLSEALAASQVIGLLDEFFDAAAGAIEHHSGVVLNHVGDAFIAAFNAPLPDPAHAEHAVQAARALQAMVSARIFRGHRLRLRIGIATGPIAAGTVGGATHQTYTVYGDTVNVAQRLERLNKEFDTDCLLSAATVTAAPSACADTKPIGSTQVPGREGTLEVFALAQGDERHHFRERNAGWRLT
jgi:class 3 adenylate cyclase